MMLRGREGGRDPSCDVEREGGRGGETPAVMLRGREGGRDPSCDVEREGGRGGETPAVMLRGREGGGEQLLNQGTFIANFQEIECFGIYSHMYLITGNY